jgi:hypothetical protein
MAIQRIDYWIEGSGILHFRPEHPLRVVKYGTGKIKSALGHDFIATLVKYKVSLLESA